MLGLVSTVVMCALRHVLEWLQFLKYFLLLYCMHYYKTKLVMILMMMMTMMTMIYKYEY